MPPVDVALRPNPLCFLPSIWFILVGQHASTCGHTSRTSSPIRGPRLQAAGTVARLQPSNCANCYAGCKARNKGLQSCGVAYSGHLADLEDFVNAGTDVVEGLHEGVVARLAYGAEGMSCCLSLLLCRLQLLHAVTLPLLQCCTAETLCCCTGLTSPPFIHHDQAVAHCAKHTCSCA